MNLNPITAIKRLFGKSEKSREQAWLEGLIDSGMMSSSGIQITKNTALQVAAAYQAVNVISGQIALLPFPLYKQDGKGRIKDRSHPVYDLLNHRFNEYTTSFDGWRTMMVNALLTPAGYIYIERANGVPRALYPIDTARVDKRVNAQTGEPRYYVRSSETTTEVSYADMLEIKGLSFEATDNIDPIKLLKNILGIHKAAEDFSGEYFKNGLHPSGVFEAPSALPDDSFKRLKNQMREMYSGLGKRHNAIILEEGMKFNAVTAKPADSQMIESRKFQIIEIARFFNIPPHKLMELDRATWNNIEEMNISFVNDTLMPYLIQIEQQVNTKMIMPGEHRAGIYAEHNVEGLMRGRTADRYASYAQGRQWGWLNVNEIRMKENMSDIGEQGDIYLTPANMSDSNQLQGEQL